MNSTGDVVHNPQEINEVFKDFYSKLYSSEHNVNQSDIDTFLNNLQLPRLSEEYANRLEAPISPVELHTALNKMTNNKSPGPDGFPAEFYKFFWKILSPLFHRVTSKK